MRPSLAALALLFPGSLAAAQEETGILEPCTLPGVPDPVECGSLAVPEDRSRDEGSTVELRIVRLGATGDEAAPEPLFILLGGPGEAAAGAAAAIARRYGALRETRDLVLFDQRGTGESNGLDCTLYHDDLERAFADLLPPDALRECRAELARGADLRHYTTENHAHDLDDVRAALGYHRVDLHGGSYGTRAALVYIRRHEERVRSAVLLGAHPPGARALPRFAPDAQRALEGVLGECEADPRCARAFPTVRDDAREVFQALREAPEPVRVIHPATGEPEEVLLNATVAGEAVRYMLYRPAWAGMLPVVLHQARRGDPSGLAEFAVFARLRMIEGPGNGLWISITCQEEAGTLDLEEAARSARGTLFDDHRARNFARACERWPHEPVDPSFHEPVTSAVPALLLSGEWDPVTPPVHGDRAALHLPGALHVVVPSGGHAFEGLEGAECADELVEAFLVAGAAEDLDVGCVDEIRRPPFRTEPLFMEPATVEPERVQPLAGTYAGGEVPLEIEVRAVDGGLEADLPDGTTLLLVPVEGDELRFRPPGLPGLYLVFGRGPDGSRQVWIEEPGEPPLLLERR